MMAASTALDWVVRHATGVPTLPPELAGLSASAGRAWHWCRAGFEFSSATLSFAMGWKRDHARRVIRELADAGYLRRLRPEYYQATR